MGQEFIDFEQSLQIIRSLQVSWGAKENVFIADMHRRVGAEDVVADSDNPVALTASMDGYALQYASQDKKLQIVGDNPAGSKLSQKVSSHNCIKTFTGSLMPKGSDTLVPIENVTAKNTALTVQKKVPKGFACRMPGETYAKGEVLIPKGSTLGWSEAAVLASVNRPYMSVFQKPKVAIASSGSELLELGQRQQNDAQIRSANHIALQSMVEKCGAHSVQYGVVADNKEAMLQTVQKALLSCEIVITTGGVSVGDYDFTKEVIEKCGAKILFHGVKIKPGQHLLLSQKGNKFILALPGFAYSAMVTAFLYLPALLALYYERNYVLKTFQAVMQEDFSKPAGKTAFFAVRVTNTGGKLYADFGGKKFGSSADLTNLKSGDGLLMLEPHTTQIKKGQEVRLLLL